MKYFIPIAPELNPILELLNGGVAPLVEAERTFLLVDTEHTNDILTVEEMTERINLMDGEKTVTVFTVFAIE